MTKTTILLIEVGMLAGIITAGCVLPRNTPLPKFLAVSAICFVGGSLLLIRRARSVRAERDATPNETDAWTHIRRAFGILAIGGLVALLFLALQR